MATSVLDTCILSILPIEVAHLFNGTFDTFCLFKAESMLDYSGPLILHTLPNLSMENSVSAQIWLVSKQILDSYGETWEDYPSLCMLGKAYIHSIQLYDAKTFEDDMPNHGNDQSLAEFQTLAGFDTSELVYGIRLHKIEAFDEPVIDVELPEDVIGTSIWLPRTPLQMEAVKKAKTRKPATVEGEA